MGIKGKQKKKEQVEPSSPLLNTPQGYKVTSRDAKFLPPSERLINRLDESGFSPLHWAVRRDNLLSAETFLSNYGNVDILDKNGKTALEWAIALKRYSFIIFLLDVGATVPENVQLYDIESRRTLIQKEREKKTLESISKIANENGEDPKLDLSFHYFSNTLQFGKIEETLNNLSLAFNNLTKIPEEIFKLKNLQHLNLSNNLLFKVDDKLDTLALQTLNLSNNYLSEFPKIGELSAKWTSLDVSYNKISSIPMDIHKLYRLITFNCSHNHLTELPKSIVEVLGIQHFNFSNNFISHLRDIPFHLLSSLETLDLSYNLLTEIPYSDFINSQTLKTLHFKHNKISTEVYKILKCYFNQEKSLNLSSMNLTSLLPEVQLLIHLQDLNVSDNCFSVLPSEIGHLTDLTNLDISYNPFSDLPLFIHRLTNLKSINLEETKNVVNPPKSITGVPQHKLLKTLMDYYQDLLQGEPCYRLKLMFVGQGTFFFSFFVSIKI